ncbi:MAG: helix-turn-helix transcriptional regulator [Actinobacteria bacterium]|nr:helix-turn-helix transcriptional regulator [Actinomycetota bacterium]
MPERRKTSGRTTRRRAATREAVAQTTRIADARAAARALETKREPRARAPGDRDPFTGELRRRGVLPMLVLHFMSDGPSYGNALMERIASVTEGVLHVNPNTMYPLLRQLEEQGLVRGEWEHPERRSRRYYSLTGEGRREYRRLVKEVRPLLDSIGRSISEIVREVYG